MKHKQYNVARNVICLLGIRCACCN